MIDWAAMVADSALNLPKDEAKGPCSDSTGRNKPQKSEKVGTAETRAPLGFPGSVPTVPTVPTVFEWSRVSEDEKHNPSSFIEPAGGGRGEALAPQKYDADKDGKQGCSSCEFIKRPGLSGGLCGGGRDDLPAAFTPGHPLRLLPSDGGASCPRWALHWSFSRVLPG